MNSSSSVQTASTGVDHENCASNSSPVQIAINHEICSTAWSSSPLVQYILRLIAYGHEP